MIHLLLILALLPLIFTFLFQFKNRKAAKTLVPPGPPGLPMIGNLHQFVTATNLHIHLWKLSRKHGSLMHMKLGPVRILVVSSAKLAKEVLKTQDSVFCSRPKLLGQQKLSYNCLDIAFSPYSDYWKEMRKVSVVHLFSLKKAQSFRPVREDEISRMVAKIQALAASSDRVVVNLSEMVTDLATTLICRTAFGRRYDERGSERRRFDRLLRDGQAAMADFYVSDYYSLFSWVDKLSGKLDRLDESWKNLDLFYQELIDDHLDRKRGKIVEEEEEEDILDVLIRIKEQKVLSSDLTWDHIKAMLMDIFIAGTDTSIASIIWTMTALMKAPDVMKKVQTEIRELIGIKCKVDEVDIQNLSYMRAVINETMRLYPPTPLLLPRETIDKCILDGYEIQPKTIVYVNAWAVARDPEYWEDPHAFLPDRFLNSGADIKGNDFRVLPFGSGRRICPGMYMGLANVELAVANLLYFFDWELPPGMQEQILIPIHRWDHNA
ncbi:UNVERIFIED_CONTAM: cytochrome [Sesamum latifolium]|uniref:Cytochrome n=1 Tax=Sesamum latifolium TaxID=2727402 RepID=A0AAW2VUL8_9LAMI